MKSWRSCNIGEVVKLEQGLAINKKTNHLIVDEGLPLLRITDLKNNTQRQFIDVKRVRNKFVAKPSDIIFSRTGQVGLVFKGRIGVIHNNCFKVIPNEYIDSNYLYWFLKQETVKEYANLLASGAAQPDLNHDAFRSIPFSYPPLPTQRKIAAILSAYDDLIENNTRRIQILEEMAQAIYRQWFVEFKFPGHEDVPLVDSGTKLGMIPKGWEIKKLIDIALLHGGYSFKSKDFVNDGNYKIVTIKNVQDGTFIPEISNQINAIPYNLREEDYLTQGDILLSLTGNVGRTCLVYGDNYLLNQRVGKLIPLDIQKRAFVYFTFRQPIMLERIQQISTGVAQQNLSLTNTRELPILIPDESTIEQFSNFGEIIIEETLSLLIKNTNLRVTRDLLLPRLVSGELDVSGLDVAIPKS